jgi:hypothetical protein
MTGDLRAAADPADDCAQAIAAGTRFLHDKQLRPDELLLISAQTLFADDTLLAPGVWHLRYKLRSLLPEATGGVIGAGGEVLLAVDLQDGAATTLLGHGE